VDCDDRCAYSLRDVGRLTQFADSVDHVRHRAWNRIKIGADGFCERICDRIRNHRSTALGE
jgi:hypothetical protein